MGLNWRMDQLLAYPHGCIEQTTSKILPQIFLPNLTELSTVERERAEENVMEGLNRLRNFQLANGGFSYWPGDDYISEWGTSYAGHMMLLAEREGFSLPSRMKMLWVNYQRSETNSWRDKQRFGGQLNQAYRLYTLALAGKAELGAMNRLSQSSNLNSRTRYMLALAYAELGKNQMAKKLIQEMNLPKEGGVNYLSDYTYGSPIRDKSIRLLYLSQVGDKETAFHLVKEISTIMDSRRWLSTQSMAFGLMAVNNYYSGQKPEGIKFKLDWDGKDNSFDSKTFVWKKELKMDSKKARPMRVKNESDGSLYMRLILKGTPIEGMEKEVSENLKMNLIYMDMEGKELDPVRIEQGTDFKAIVEIHNPGLLGNYSEMALTQVFPSGWEIINTRLLGLNNESSRSDYVDIRDDRVYTYFDIRERTTLRYVVILNAAYEGKFYLPAVNCSAMYDNSINAVKKGRWVEVYKQ